MARILVIGVSAKSAGGKSILKNFLEILCSRKSNHSWLFLVPNLDEFKGMCSVNARFYECSILSKQLFLPITFSLILPQYARIFKSDVILNLADIPIPTKTPQLFLFDWSYAAYPNSKAWKLGSSSSILKRKLKFFFFKRYLKYIDILAAQGSAVASRLSKLYNFKDIPIIPNAVSTQNLNSNHQHDFKIKGSYKLLCLSFYYSHKNIEILLPVAKLIKEHGLDWKIIITIDSCQEIGARSLLKKVTQQNLEQIIINVGPVAMGNVPSLYRQCDALLLPTLLESFSGTYVEALYHEKPIFTSNLEFAKDVCNDSAWYFDPNDANDIFEVLKTGIGCPERRLMKIESGNNLLNGMCTWESVFDKIILQLEKLLISRC